jgi:hypothetical protein
MPYPPYSAYVESRELKRIYFFLIPIFFVLGFIFIVPAVIRNVISEKESGIKVRLFLSSPKY